MIAPVSPDAGEHLTGSRFLVLGMGAAGTSATKALADVGATCVVVDECGAADAASIDGLDLSEFDAVMASEAFAPHSAAILRCQAEGLPVWSEVEFAWRIRATDAPWVLVTGTRGKTITTQMVGSIAAASGIDVAVCGTTGVTVIDAARAGHQLLSVGIAAPQLRFTSTVSPAAAVCLTVESDHLDGHGSLDDSRTDSARVYRRVRHAAVYPARDRPIETMVEEAEVVEGCRAVGITRGAPSVSQMGVVDGFLLDRAFGESRHHEAFEMGNVSDLQHLVAGEVPPYLITNALSAAALARAVGAAPEAVGAGLRSFSLDSHGTAFVRKLDGVA